MRRKNESVLLDIIRRNEGVPSADLARRSGFAPQTVSVLLKGLEEQGIVKRGEALRGRRGQPAVPMHINPEGGYSVGLELSWRHVNAVLVDLAGNTLSSHHIDYEYIRLPEVLEHGVEAIKQVIDTLPPDAREKVFGIGVAKAHNMYQTIDLLGASAEETDMVEQSDVIEDLQKHFNVPIFAANDGTLACRAETIYGLKTAPRNLLHIFVGTYIAAGIVVDGHIVTGPHGAGANVGSSMVPRANGEIHALHLVGSIKALEDRLSAAGQHVPRTAPLHWDWRAYAKELEAWLDDAALGLAIAVVNSTAVVGFETAVIDGILPEPIMDVLVTRTAERLGSLPVMTFEPPVVRRGHIGAVAPALGAADMPLHAMVYSGRVFDGVIPATYQQD